MSTKTFHISSKGEPEVCSAKIKCRLGGESGKENHFATEGEARKAFEAQMSGETLNSHTKNVELVEASDKLHDVADLLTEASRKVSKSGDESEGSEEGLANAADTIRHSLSGLDATNRSKSINQLEGTVDELRKLAAESDEPEAVAYERAAEQVADVLSNYQEGFDDTVDLTMSNGVLVRKGAVEPGG